MTDSDLLRKKLAFIETCVRELRDIARPALVTQDLREERFVEHTLQIAIQAALDVASHIVSSERLGEPRTNHELFALLETNGWLSSSLGLELRKMAGFRNLLVHGYAEVDPRLVADIVINRLGDMSGFAMEIRRRLPVE
jgi:uncharacterized protein YutE (UPF0331/DUF86 family)